MECRAAQAVVSALHDGDRPTDDEILQAAEHCRGCAECAAFRDALRILDSAPVPQPPDGLVERVMAAVDAAAAAPEPVSTAPGAGPATPPPGAERGFLARLGLTGGRAWAAAGTLAAAAAVVIGIAVFASGRGASDVATTASSAESAKRAALAPAPSVAGAGSTFQGAAGKSVASPYISFAGRVYRPGPSVSASASVAETIGTTASAFAETGPATTVAVHRTTLTDGSIAVAAPSGLQLFAPVVRALGSVTYQLDTGADILHYGQWPSLPATYPVPALANGSPTFREAGTDALGVTVYTVPGTTTDAGFAVAPGTAPGDPAGGNPNWTWWAPLGLQ